MSNGKSTMNWIIIIVAINFLAKGEKLVRKLLGADGSKSAAGFGETAQAGKEGMRKGSRNVNSVAGMFRNKK